MFQWLKEVVADDKGCSTYDLTRSVAEEIVLPSIASNPKNTTHHMGLYFMTSRGSQLVNCIKAYNFFSQQIFYNSESFYNLI